MDAATDGAPARGRLGELAVLFLRLGVTAFGGPAAHVAMMEDEVVRRRKWLTAEEFLDLVGATNLIPGPNSTELAIHIGHRRAGWAGLVVAGTCFIVPAAVITLALAWVYVRFGKIPQVGGVLYGVKPVIIVVVVQALWKLGRTAVKTKLLAALGVIAAVAAFFRAEELVVLFAAGFIAVLLSYWGPVAPPGGPVAAPPGGPAAVPPGERKSANSGLFAAGATVTAAAGASSPAVVSAWALFFVFAKIGSVLFGSGYVLLAFLRTELVAQRQWLTDVQLVDAVAVGQLTPGPVFTTATFVGYVIHGFGGAAAATLGIFLPAFVFVALSGLLIPKLRASKRAGAFLDGVNVASLALMAVVTVDLGRASLIDVPAVGLALASAVLLFRFKVNSAWLVVGGAAVGTAVKVLAG